MRRKNNYWQRREAEALKHYVKEEKEYDKRVNRIYSDMLAACQNEIDAFYGKYASKEGISINEAKKRCSKLDIAAYERKAKKYVEDAARDRKANGGKTNFAGDYFSKKANEEMELYNLTMKVNRLELLKANIGLELVKGHAELEGFMGEILEGRTLAELQRQAGILGKTVLNNAQKAHAIVNASFNNATFSDRIWMYQDMMKADLSKMLQSGLIQGKNPRALAKELRRYFKGDERLKNGKSGAIYNTERLMRTELARVQTEAQKQSFERNGFDYYEFIVNGGCCPICEAIAGDHFKVSDMMPGKNAPPMHPHCRCSTAAYEDEEDYEAWLDYLETGGTTISWQEMKETLANSGNGGRIKTITVDNVLEAVKGGSIKEDVANKIYSILEKHGASKSFEKVKTAKLGDKIVFQTDPVRVGTFFDRTLVLNEDVLGGKSVAEIDALFAKAANTVANSLEDAVVHETYHAKLISDLNYAQLESLYDELDYVHIDGISRTAYSDGAECIAEVGVMIERGDANKVPEAAMKLFEKYMEKEK